jgi:TonB family protein
VTSNNTLELTARNLRASCSQWRAAIVAITLLSACAIGSTPSSPRAATPGTAAEEVLALIGSDIQFPEESRRAGHTGTVVLRMNLLRGGEIERVWIHKTSGDTLLDREALRAVNALRSRGTRLKWWPAEDADKLQIVGELEVKFALK